MSDKDTLLQQATTFRIVDIEGVALPNPGDSIRVRENKDFIDTVRFSLKRDRGFHGVNFEFSDSSSSLGFDNYPEEGETMSGRELLNTIYRARLSIGRADFEILINNVVEVRMRIIFKGRKRRLEQDIYRVKTTYFNDNFFNYENQPYNLNRTETLTGSTTTPVSYLDMVLTPQAITKKAVTAKEEADDIFEAGDTTRGVLNLGVNIANNFNPGPITYNTQLITSFAEFPHLNLQDFGYYFVRINELVYRVRCTNSCTLVLRALVYDRSTSEIISTDIMSQDSYLPADVGTIKTITVTPTISDELFGNKNQQLIIYLEAESLNFAEIDHLNTRSSNVEVTGRTKGIFLNTKYVELNAAIQKLTEGVTGSSSPVTSSFLSSQRAALMSGKLVRGFPETEPFEIRLDEALMSLRAIYGQGYSITEETGSQKINIGFPSDFYQDVEIDYIDNPTEWEEFMDEKSLWSKIEVGYKTFSQGSDTVLLNDSIKDFLSRQEYRTPINSNKNTFSRVSDWITSGYIIEEGKQQDFNNFPDESWKHDDDVFLVAINDSQNTIFDQVVNVQDVSNLLLLTILQAAPDEVVNATSVEIQILGSPFLGPFPVTSVLIDRDANTTFIVTSAPGFDLGYLPHVDIVFSGISWTAPEGGEAFDVISGVDDQNATYNARFNLKNMLFANSLILNSGFSAESGTAEHVLTRAKNNANLETRFASGENFSTLDPDRVQIVQSDNLTLAIINQNNKIYIAELCSFKAQIGYDRISDIRKAHTNQLPGKNYGFIRVLDPVEKVDKKWYLLEMGHNTLSNEMDFLGIRKFE